MSRLNDSSGFSLIELLVATTLLLVISAAVTSALMQMTNAQKTIWNRTEMHSGVRGATELLQQEVGQAGRISLPNPSNLANPLTITPAVNGVGGSAPAASSVCDPAHPLTNAVTVAVSSTSGLWATAGPPESYVNLTTLDGNNEESIRVGAIDAGASTIQACFTKAHAAGTALAPLGGFATGIIPPNPPANIADPSTGTVLKLYGDINGDGNMVYIEYTCDLAAGNLYRNVMAFDLPAASKVPASGAQILLSNIVANPGSPSPPCFTYQTSTITVNGVAFTFVLDVAITLTVQTQQMDPITKEYQKETKALLNVSPRNVFNAWAYAGMGYSDRIQSTPTTVINLLAPVS